MKRSARLEAKSPAARPAAAAKPAGSVWQRHRREIQLCAALVLLTLVIYGQVLSFDFVYYDDNVFVTENTAVQAGVTWLGIYYAFTSFDHGSYHPLTWISHMVVYQFYGMDPGAHHAVNLLLHAACSVLLLIWLHAMTGALWRSALVACLFAVHPLHVEVVAWIAERKEILAALFWMLTFLAWHQWVRGGPRKWYWIAVAMYLCGLMSKPTIVTTPFLLLLLDYWPLGRLSSVAELRPRLVEKLPFFLLTVAGSVSTYVGQGIIGALHQNVGVSIATRVMNVPANYLFYLYTTFWPVDLAPSYPFDGKVNLIESVAGVVVLAVISLLVLWKGRQRRYLITGWFWFLGVIVPMSGLVIAGDTIRSDRFTYGAHIGLGILIVWGLHDLLGERRTALGVRIAAGLLLAVTVARAWDQTAIWRDTLILFRHTVAVTRDNWAANVLVGGYYMRFNRGAEARPYIQEALRIDPNYGQGHVILARIQFVDRQDAEALASLDRAIRLIPDDAGARLDRGRVLAAMGREAEARQSFQAALERQLESAKVPQAWFEMGRSFVREHQEAKAIPYFEKAIALDPFYVLARKNLGFALMQQGRNVEAYGHFRMLSSEMGDEDVQRSLRYLGTIVK